MEPEMNTGGVVTATSLAEFFRGALRGALADQHLAVEEHTEHYVVNVLTLFARAERLHESAGDGPHLKPLAQMLADALEAVTATQRDLALQRLGDVSLFMAGLFARGFARRLVDVDYHIAMGGRAYDARAGPPTRSKRSAPAQVSAALPTRFRPIANGGGERGAAAQAN